MTGNWDSLQDLSKFFKIHIFYAIMWIGGITVGLESIFECGKYSGKELWQWLGRALGRSCNVSFLNYNSAFFGFFFNFNNKLFELSVFGPFHFQISKGMLQTLTAKQTSNQWRCPPSPGNVCCYRGIEFHFFCSYGSKCSVFNCVASNIEATVSIFQPLT